MYVHMLIVYIYMMMFFYIVLYVAIYQQYILFICNFIKTNRLHKTKSYICFCNTYLNTCLSFIFTYKISTCVLGWIHVHDIYSLSMYYSYLCMG